MTNEEYTDQIAGHRARNRQLKVEFESREIVFEEPRPIEFQFWANTQRDAAVVARALLYIKWDS